MTHAQPLDLAALLDTDAIEAETPTELAIRLATLRRLIADVKRAESDVEMTLAERMPDKLFVPEVGMLERKHGKNRTAWRHEEAAASVVTAAADELGHPMDVARLILRCAGIGYWKVTELRALGLDTDQLCETRPGRTSIVIVEQA